jgi:hypothetical protein
VVISKELAYWDQSKVNLVKIHGSCDRPDSLIITEQDYNTVYQRKKLVMQHLNSLLAIHTFLFIGYSVSDPDFNQVYDRLGVELGPHQCRPYIVTFDTDPFKMEDMKQRGYYVIRLPNEGDRNAHLARWLKTLADATNRLLAEGP